MPVLLVGLTPLVGLVVDVLLPVPGEEFELDPGVLPEVGEELTGAREVGGSVNPAEPPVVKLALGVGDVVVPLSMLMPVSSPDG